MENRICEICGNEFTPNRKDRKTCYEYKCKRERSRRNTQEYRRRKAKKEGREHRVDIGRGGGQPKGDESKHFKNGIQMFQKIRNDIRNKRKNCEDCGKNLVGANRYEWCVHHIDHDRTNNKLENFKLLCKRCHQIEHECWKAFESSTTSRKT